MNKNGEVVGMNTWIGTGVRNNQAYTFSQLNFAIEGELIQRLVAEIIENDGRIRRNFLGIEFLSRGRRCVLASQLMCLVPGSESPSEQCLFIGMDQPCPCHKSLTL